MEERDQIQRAEQIEAYLNKKLSEEQMNMLTERINYDPEFAKEVEAHALLRLALQDAEVPENPPLKRLLNEIEQERDSHSKSSTSQKIRPMFIWASIAAAIIIFFLTYLINIGQYREKRDLFADHHYRLGTELATRSSAKARIIDSTEVSTYNQWFVYLHSLYVNQEFEQLFDKAKEYSQQSKTFEEEYLVETLLLLGVANLEMKKKESLAEALKLFEAIPMDTEEEELFEVWFFKAEVYIQLGKMDPAKELLQQIPSSAQNYSQAQGLLKAMGD